MSGVGRVDGDTMFFQVLDMQYDCCRLLVLFAGLVQLQVGVYPPMVWPDSPAHERAVIGKYGAMAVTSAEQAIASVLSLSRHPGFLSTAPDHIYALFCIAITFSLKARSVMLEQAPAWHPSKASDLLLSHIVRALHEAALSPGHIAYRYAKVIASLIASWDRKVQKRGYCEDLKTDASVDPPQLPLAPPSEDPSVYIASTNHFPLEGNWPYLGFPNDLTMLWDTIPADLMGPNAEQLSISAMVSDPAFATLFAAGSGLRTVS